MNIPEESVWTLQSLFSVYHRPPIICGNKLRIPEERPFLYIGHRKGGRFLFAETGTRGHAEGVLTYGKQSQNFKQRYFLFHVSCNLSQCQLGNSYQIEINQNQVYTFNRS